MLPRSRVTTSARLLALLGLLQSRPSWSGPELAARLEVTERTIRNDIERLASPGLPRACRPRPRRAATAWATPGGCRRCCSPTARRWRWPSGSPPRARARPWPSPPRPRSRSWSASSPPGCGRGRSRCGRAPTSVRPTPARTWPTQWSIPSCWPNSPSPSASAQAYGSGTATTTRWRPIPIGSSAGSSAGIWWRGDDRPAPGRRSGWTGCGSGCPGPAASPRIPSLVGTTRRSCSGMSPHRLGGTRPDPGRRPRHGGAPTDQRHRRGGRDRRRRSLRAGHRRRQPGDRGRLDRHARSGLPRRPSRRSWSTTSGSWRSATEVRCQLPGRERRYESPPALPVVPALTSSSR